MAQFTVYASTDAGAGNPGNLTGQAGDLLRVLDLVLVNGYTGKAAAGWSKPFANAGNIGCYKNASTANGGSGFGVVINDNGANITSTYKEAWATGWESIAGVGSPVGTGSGQFPTPAQLLTSGHVVVRKSLTADGTGRAWTCYADSLTFYLFIYSGDVAGQAFPLWFGDFFSLAGSSDAFRGMIMGRAIENSAGTGTTNQNDDVLWALGGTPANTVGQYAARSYGGGGTSIQVVPMGAYGLLPGISAQRTANVGALTAPNGPDNSYYLPPIWVGEIIAGVLRGRFRGLYHSAHALATWANGQVVTGAADFAGKTLQAVTKGVNGGMWFVETSNTVETN
jgi:hypothetical protein